MTGVMTQIFPAVALVLVEAIAVVYYVTQSKKRTGASGCLTIEKGRQMETSACLLKKQQRWDDRGY